MLCVEVGVCSGLLAKPAQISESVGSVKGIGGAVALSHVGDLVENLLPLGVILVSSKLLLSGQKDSSLVPGLLLAD